MRAFNDFLWNSLFLKLCEEQMNMAFSWIMPWAFSRDRSSQTFTYLVNTVVSFFQCLSDCTGLSKSFAWQVFNLYFTLLEDMSALKRSLSNLLRLKINRYADSANLHRFSIPLLIFLLELMSPLNQKPPYIAVLISAVPDHVQGPSFCPNQLHTVSLLRF